MNYTGNLNICEVYLRFAQKYMDEAAEDKQRYMRELTEYQQSSEYQEFVAKHRAKGQYLFDTVQIKIM